MDIGQAVEFVYKGLRSIGSPKVDSSADVHDAYKTAVGVIVQAINDGEAAKAKCAELQKSLDEALANLVPPATPAAPSAPQE